jgi:nucleotide-binding universal stress UspA family protein
MRTILVNLELSPVLDSVLDCALRVGRTFGGHIEALHVRPGQPDIIAAGADGFVAAAPDLVAGFEREARERAERARAAFEEFAARHGLPRGPDAGGAGGAAAAGPTADWRVEAGSADAVLGSRGRVFDLIVVGRPLPDAVSPSMAALETALFEAGRPLLIAPPQPPPGPMGETVVIAWNGSTESARTVAFAMPLLERARRVVVLAVQPGGMVPGPSAAELARNLRRDGIEVEHREAPAAGRQAGPAILEEARALGADLLVKGAYTQSRLRQMIFGGATSHILAKAELPVLMAN